MPGSSHRPPLTCQSADAYRQHTNNLKLNFGAERSVLTVNRFGGPRGSRDPARDRAWGICTGLSEGCAPHVFRGALGGTRTPTILLTATSRQRVYQFRHERLGNRCGKVLRTGSTARDVTNRRWRDKGCRPWQKSTPERNDLAAPWQPRKHLFHFDGDAVAVDQHHPACDRQAIGEYLDLVGLGGVQFYDGATAQPHYLMDGHRCGPEDHHQVYADFIEGWHGRTTLRTSAKLRGATSPRYG
jgi:hypothetical protein